MVSARIAQNKRRVASYIGAGIVPPQGGGVAPIVPPYPAPSGYEWAFVVENGNRVVENGNRVIELKRAA